MPEEHERLDEAMNQRRLALRMTWQDVAKGAGISYEALRAIRRGDSKPTELTARALDEALQWVPGSVYSVLRGGEPITIETQDSAPAPAVTEPLPPSEALRRMVRASARELGMTSNDVNETMRLVRQDLELPQPSEPAAEPSRDRGPSSRLDTGRTDLSDYVRDRRREVGMSLEDVSARTVDPASGERVIDAAWLDRLEKAELHPDEYPEYPQLDALVDVLHLDPGQVQDAAGVQFMDIHTVWSEDGEVRAIVRGELSAEDLVKVQTLMNLYRKAPRRDGRNS